MINVTAGLRGKLKSALYRAVPPSRLAHRGPTSTRRVALTFDDGPDHMTRAYLDRLDELGVPATFFLIGQACAKEPELVREYVRRGHQIANHGWDHMRFPKLRWSALRDQIERVESVLGPRTTARPWVRPPHGDFDARVLGQLLAHGQTIAMWSLDPQDYDVHDADEIARRCEPSRVAPGEVILLHEGQQWTLDALPRIVRGLRGAGYEMVTMADMFAA